jgi:uncharacterized membrane protein (UPF0127 family)
MDKRTLYCADVALTTELRVCGSFLERARGLLFRPPMQASLGEAMLIPRCDSIHMFGMTYPITVLFLDDNSRIVKICPMVKQWRIAGKRGASCAIECAVGSAWVNQIAIGQQLKW